MKEAAYLLFLGLILNKITAVVKNCIADELSRLTPRVTNCHIPSIKSKIVIANITLEICSD